MLARLAWARALDGLGEQLQLLVLGWCARRHERARRGGRAARAVCCVEFAVVSVLGATNGQGAKACGACCVLC